MMMVAKSVGLKPGKFTHFVDNLHIYDRHIEQAIEIYNRMPKQNEEVDFLLNTEETDFYKISLSDFELNNYYPIEPQLKFEVAE